MIAVQSRANLDRLVAGANREFDAMESAVGRLAKVRLAALHSDDPTIAAQEVRVAQQAVVDARLSAIAAHRVARQQGSGSFDDPPRFDFERGSMVNILV